MLFSGVSQVVVTEIRSLLIYKYVPVQKAAVTPSAVSGATSPVDSLHFAVQLDRKSVV